MRRGDRVWIAGHTGLVGSAIVRRLERDGLVAGRDLLLRTRDELDLRDADAVRAMLEAEQPTHAIVAAARVGGIHANSTMPVEFLRDNLQIELAVLDGAWRAGVGKLLFLGSSCIYPRLADQPIREESLLAGPLEPTNEPYAIAKIAGIKLCQAYRHQHGAPFISAMPTNLYGPGDNFDLATSHVLPAMIRRFVEARDSGAPVVTLWGTGTPRREFLHVDDLADACVHLMRTYDDDAPINVGTGEDVTIASLARLVADVVGYRGAIDFDPTRPDGTPRKLLDVSRIHALGWRHAITLEQGVHDTCAWYEAHAAAPA